MTTSVLAFVGAFLFACILLLGVLLTARLHWQIKAALTVASLGVGLGLYRGYVDSLGWPTLDAPVGTVQFLQGVERAPTASDRGAIYLWALPARSGLPRAFELPDTQQNRKAIRQAQQGQKSGETVFLAMTPGQAKAASGNGRSDGAHPDHGHGAGSAAGAGGDYTGTALAVVPGPDTLPRKD